MPLAWFKPLGWVHRPASFAGWFLTFFTLLLIAWVFVAVDRRSHSSSDTLIGVFPWAWIFLVTLNWVASKTSGR